MKYVHGFQFEIEGKEMSKEHFESIKILISKFLIDNDYENSKIFRVGLYDSNFNPKWEKCEEVLKEAK